MTLSVGIDLAQARDRTAIAAVSSYFADGEEIDDDTPRRRKRRAKHHSLIRLDMLRAGLSYPAQVELIVEIAASLDSDEKPTLYVDATGVGRAVVDLIRAASPFPVKAITFTSAAEVVRHGQNISVPKTELISSLEIALSTRRLHAVADLPLAKDLDRELRAFSYELSATGRPQYEGKGQHDDLVIALALGVWGGERGGGLANFRQFMAGEIEKNKARGHIIEPRPGEEQL